jgi:cysteinyl-tRNA synthetase
MKIFNTLSGQKEEFAPIGDVVTMYVCGVTVYDECHIGHAMSYILFDTIKRYLEFKGYNVKHVQNFTDIDDKIINRAQQVGVSAKELSEKYIAEFYKDMDALNIKRASLYPKATEEVPDIINVIRGLIDKGYAYASRNSVYFRVKQFPQYGKLSHQNVNDMVSKETKETESKESPLDFALWKAAKIGEPSWTSPWGEGRPGWHIECTAMSLKYLGKTIDFHGGGQDLIFPHHENEITQSESYTGESPFVRFWLHNGLLQFSGDKMSKSLGNLISIKNALKNYSSDALRLFILGSHYRSPLTYTESNIEASESGLQRLRQALVKTTTATIKDQADVISYKQKFIDSMDDDFNTAQAIAVLFDLVREINRCKNDKIGVIEAQYLLSTLATTLGFTLKEPDKTPIDIEPLAKMVQHWQSELTTRLNLASAVSTSPRQDAESQIQTLISIRNTLRKSKQWEMADKLRLDLLDLGISLDDSAKGTCWKQVAK